MPNLDQILKSSISIEDVDKSDFYVTKDERLGASKSKEKIF
jgi:hypothetical protein